jgi:hypothetical protein
MTFPSAAWLMAKPLVSKGGVAVLDTFTDPDATNLSAHTPDIDSVGGGWTVVQGTNTIQSNTSEPSIGGAWGMSLIDSGVTDLIMTGRTVWPGEGTALLYIRATDINNFIAARLDRYALGGFDIVKRVGGSFSSEAQPDPDPTNNHGAGTVDFRITAIGTSITIEDVTNGVTVGPATIPDFPTVTNIGFGDHGGDSQWSMDNLQVVGL